MPALDDSLQQKLRLLEAKGQRRAVLDTRYAGGVQVVREGKSYISFSSNDYLGLSHHPGIIEAAQQAAAQHGAGAGASRLVTGNYPLYAKLEQALAQAKGCEAACVFGSGYLANIGAIPALAGKGDLLLLDKLAHACMYDAARLSGATVLRFAHNNVAHCRMLLEANRKAHHHCLIVTETVFSMDGDLAPLAELAALAREFDGWLMTDDAHGFGLLPAHEADVKMGTLSKAAGSYGGYVCGSQMLVEYLQNAARSLIFSTGLPPAAVGAALEGIRIMQREPQRAQIALGHARRFSQLLGLAEAQSAIVPVVLGDNDKALAASALLAREGFLVAAIRPPTVPEHTARLRFAFTAQHEAAQVEAVANIIKGQGWV